MMLEEFLDFLYRLIWAFLLSPLILVVGAGVLLGVLYLHEWLQEDNMRMQFIMLILMAGVLVAFHQGWIKL